MSEQLAQRVEVVNRNGLHARPASLLVELAKGFQSEISIVTDGHEVDGKSILEVLSLAAARGTMLEVRAEGMTSLEPDAGFLPAGDGGTGLRKDRRWSTTARYLRKMGKLKLRGEGAFGRHDDITGADQTTGGILTGARYRLFPQLEVGLSQEALLGGDDQVLGEGIAGRLTTRADAGWEVMDGLVLGMGHALRWDGSHGIKVGARTRLDRTTDAYLEQRWMDDIGGGATQGATVVGAESRLDGGGRAYGEYRMDGGIGGRTNRAVIGMGRRIQLSPGISVSAGYERQEAFGGSEGVGSRDVISGGVELLPWDWLKFGGRYELRLDHAEDHSATESERDLVQALAHNGLSVKFTDRFTLMGILSYHLTQNLGQRTPEKGWGVEQEGLEASLAGIYRPPGADWLTAIGRISRYQRRHRFADSHVLRLDGEGPLEERETAVLIGGSAIMELPWNLLMTEKLTYASREMRGESDIEERVDLLWISRIGYRFLESFDASAEFRLLLEMASGGLGSGALAEVGYQPLPLLRVALGYDFSSIPRELGPVESDQGAGAYLRVTGRY